jgi:hypothetical protein
MKLSSIFLIHLLYILVKPLVICRIDYDHMKRSVDKVDKHEFICFAGRKETNEILAKCHNEMQTILHDMMRDLQLGTPKSGSLKLKS